MYCGNCGRLLKRGELFCGECGTPISQTTLPMTSRQRMSKGSLIVGRKGRRMFLVLILIALVILVFSLMQNYKSSAKELEEGLPGAWYCYYTDGAIRKQFTLYDDGTCDISGTYGSGSWRIVNEYDLRITDFYGSTDNYRIISLKDGFLYMEVDRGNIATTRLFINSETKDDVEEGNYSTRRSTGGELSTVVVKNDEDALEPEENEETASLIDTRMVDDKANIFSEQEERTIEREVTQYSDELEWNIIIATTKSTDGLSIQEYADDIYDDNYDINSDGVAIVIDTSDRVVYISTSGDAIAVLTDKRIDDLLESGADYLKKQHYYKAVFVMLDMIKEYADTESE